MYEIILLYLPLMFLNFHPMNPEAIWLAWNFGKARENFVRQPVRILHFPM